MTNKEAITKLTNIMHDDHYSWHPSILTAFGMAVDALKGSGCEGDLISRQAAIDAMTTTLWNYPNECYRNLNEYEFAKGLAELGLKSVPSAQTEPCEDFVKVVRCEKCRYVHCDKEFDNYWCNRMSGAFMVEAEGFCKWGR